MAHYLQEAYWLSLRRSFQLANLSPSLLYLKNRDRGNELPGMRRVEITAASLPYGFG